jgi:hypothetical protein
MRILAVTLTGITFIFLISFTWTVLEGEWQGIWQGLFLLLAPAAMALLAGRLAPSGQPEVAGAVVALLSFVAGLYGGYVAYLTGWGGLDVGDFGGDMEPEGQILVLTVAWALPILVVGAVLGVVGTIRR